MVYWAFFFFVLNFHLLLTFGMLDCDPVFVKDLDQYLSSNLPSDVPNRQVFLEGLNKEILGVYHSYFKQKKYLRIIDVRSVAELKKLIIDKLKGKEFSGMNDFWMFVWKIRETLTQAMKNSLEDFANLACSEDCSVIEGPLLDCWTCLRIRAQCFDGSVCGEEDDREAEIKEINVYLFLVVEFAILSFILILCYIFIYHDYKIKTSLTCKEKETILIDKTDQEDKGHDEVDDKHFSDDGEDEHDDDKNNA